MKESLKVKTYEEALAAFRKDGMRAEHKLRIQRRGAALIIGALLALYAIIGGIALSAGSSPAGVLRTVGIVIPATSPFLALGLLRIVDTTKKIKVAKTYQDGTRFDGMSEEAVVSLWNDNLKEN